MPNTMTPDWSEDVAGRAPAHQPARSSTAVPDARRLRAYAARPLRHLPSVVFVAILLAVAYAGWRNNEEGHLTPEKGLGYWLGIVGSLAMLALLLYPLRKRLGRARWLGSTALWFRAHMMLGLLGPALILVHCNFRPGSLNSTVALIAMLLVSGSGLVGRYLYSRVHYGLYGRKARMQEILDDRTAWNAAIGAELPEDNHILAQLREHAGRMEGTSKSVRLLAQRARSRRLKRRLLREAKSEIRAQARLQGWDRREARRRTKAVRRHLACYFSAADKAALLGVYDGLLSAWHVAHLPMFFLLVLAAITHVVAVHLY